MTPFYKRAATGLNPQLPDTQKYYDIMSLPVMVAACGYFVDLYDLLLFSAVRIPSLKDLGVAESELFSRGVFILNLQMAGLVLGGLLFGVLADKFGRTRLMFVSITTYSLATMACAFVGSVHHYEILRFLAGLGMAGEVGLAITFVSEILPQAKRGHGTGLIAGFGVSGAIVAGICAQLLPWRICYIIGGLLGLALLLLRTKVAESLLFFDQRPEAFKGSLRFFIKSKKRIRLYVLCILTGTPITYVLWLMAGFAPELTGLLGLSVPLSSASAIMTAYIGLSLGNLASGSLSQFLQSRRTAMTGFILWTLAACFFFLFFHHSDHIALFYVLYFAMGFGAGYWIVICTAAAEMFGTNLRATVAASVPNLIRASFIPMGFAVTLMKPMLGMVPACLITGALVFALAGAALRFLPETHAKDLRYEEI